MGGTCLIVAEDEGFSRGHRTIKTLLTIAMLTPQVQVPPFSARARPLCWLHSLSGPVIGLDEVSTPYRCARAHQPGACG